MRVANLDITALEASPGERAWAGSLASPIGDLAFFILHIYVEVGMWVGPLDLGQGSGEADRLAGVELGCKGMMGEHWHSGGKRKDRSGREEFGFHSSSIT
jgi:hypothetical protein